MSEFATQIDKIFADPEFTSLVQQRRRVIWPLMTVSMVLFFSIPFVVSQFPGVLRLKLLGPVNVGFVFLLLQYAIGGIVAYIYSAQMRQIDAHTEALKLATSSESARSSSLVQKQHSAEADPASAVMQTTAILGNK